MGSTFRKGSEQSGQSAGASAVQADWANRLGTASMPTIQAAGAPIQSYLQNVNTQNQQLGNWLGGGMLPPSLMSGLNGQYANLALNQNAANQQLLDTGARGGQLQSLQANNALNTQAQRLGLMSQLQQGLWNQAQGGAGASLFANMAGQPGTAMQGLGSAAGNLNELGAQRIGQNMAFQSGLGQFAGSGFNKGMRAMGK